MRLGASVPDGLRVAASPVLGWVSHEEVYVQNVQCSSVNLDGSLPGFLEAILKSDICRYHGVRLLIRIADDRQAHD